MEKYDFSGWATRNNIKCSDGRTIMKDAFLENDGKIVPLVWNHQHNEPENVLGHAMLQNRPEGVYAYGTFNESESGQLAKVLVQHGDVVSLSIYANQLKQAGSNVVHGAIREVSLVLAGANPGAYIDAVMAHSEDGTEELTAGVIYNDEAISLEAPEPEHAEEIIEHAEEKTEEAKPVAEEKKETNEKEETVADVFETLTEKQKTVVYALIGQALEEANKANKDDEGEKEEMKHNVFDSDEKTGNFLSHAEQEAIFADAKRLGSLKAAVIAHSEDADLHPTAAEQEAHTDATYGINYMEYLFPEAKSLNNPPEWISRNMDWVKAVMGGVHHTPFSRVKSVFANITEADARARGYVKGNQKVEEVFGLLKRSTAPQTIYKKQKLDRDDVIDITDFDVVAWIKSEMRMMLDEEIARAILIGDGRLNSSDDKINPLNIRPIVSDDPLFTIQKQVESGIPLEKAIVRAAVKARKDYRGSGNPVFFTTEDVLTDLLLQEDQMGHRLYKTTEELCNAMRVSKVVTVPVMENLTDDDDLAIYGIIVNLNDYNVGADKGGAVSMFDDFDIDYNAQKYLIETRCSGALVKPYSAIVLKAATEESESEDDGE